MLDERSEHEPEEYDPEAELYDPESDSLTIPQIDVPEIGTSEDDDGEDADELADVPADLARGFWVIVLVLDAALVAVPLGAMLIYFRGDLVRGGALVVGGLALCAFAYRRYRDVKSLAGRDESEAERSSNPRDERTPPADGDTDDT